MAPRGVLLDGIVDEAFERFDLAIEGVDDAIDAGFEGLGHHAAAILLGVLRV